MKERGVLTLEYIYTIGYRNEQHISKASKVFIMEKKNKLKINYLKIQFDHL